MAADMARRAKLAEVSGALAACAAALAFLLPASPAHAAAAAPSAPLALTASIRAGIPAFRAEAVSRRHVTPLRMKAWDWAVRNAKGCPYEWGGTGPCGDGYDCSGMVMVAYEHAGVDLPRTTYEMVGSSLLKHIRPGQARRGDLSMWFSGGSAVHVELVAYRNRWTYGAQHSGTVVGLHKRWGRPLYYMVVPSRHGS